MVDQVVLRPGVSDPGSAEVGAQCHCGAIRLTARLTTGLATARRRDCSYCRMRGGAAVTVAKGALRIVRGAEALRVYRFNTGIATHHFCGICGIYTHHGRRSNPDKYGLNAACIDGIGPFDFLDIPVMNGQRHPADGGGGVAGRLRFQPAAARA